MTLAANSAESLIARAPDPAGFMLSQMKLHNHHRSPASFQARIAFELKRPEAFGRLLPQLSNAARFNLNGDGLPRTLAACDACRALPAFQRTPP